MKGHIIQLEELFTNIVFPRIIKTLDLHKM